MMHTYADLKGSVMTKKKLSSYDIIRLINDVQIQSILVSKELCVVGIILKPLGQI